MNKFSSPVMLQGLHASPYTRKALGVYTVSVYYRPARSYDRKRAC
jgi:hypothetical protein